MFSILLWGIQPLSSADFGFSPSATPHRAFAIKLSARTEKVLDKCYAHLRKHTIPAHPCVRKSKAPHDIGEDHQREGLTSAPEEESSCPTIPT